MKLKRQFAQLACISMLAGLCLPAWADDNPSPQKSQAPDVTITVIPDGQDVVDTVIHNISVPNAVDTHKPGSAPNTGSKADNGKEFGKATADAAKQIEDSKEASSAAQHEAEDANQQAEAAKEAAESQAAQARQDDNQESNSHQHDHPDHPTPPPPPGGG